MEIDSSASNISDVVRKAREEIASVITALTELLVLAAVAVSYQFLQQKRSDFINLTFAQTSGNASAKFETNGPSADASQSRTDSKPKPSLGPVLIKLKSLRETVEQAVSLHTNSLAQAKKAEDQVTTEEKAALTERRAALVAEVRTKNEKVKLLIDKLRDLHRDIVMLLSSYYKPLSSQPR